MRNLAIYAVLVFAAMVAVTTWSSLHENVIDAALRMGRDRWSVATLFDAYFGFLWFWLWIAATERCPWEKALWLAAILLFGNLAMAAFVLLRLARMKAPSTFRDFLLGPRWA